jgi:hypothetical protein
LCVLRILGVASVLALASVPSWSECPPAFESWVKLSESRVLRQSSVAGLGSSQPAEEACIPTEAVRQELLRSLARARAKCEGSSESDQNAQQTKTLININESFIASIPLCRSADLPSWATKTDPVATRPSLPSGPCLEISRLSPDRYDLSNRRCGGGTVLAVIETRGSSGEVVCKQYTINQNMTVTTQRNSRPQINYECLISREKCTKEHLGNMFPECD